MCSHIRRVYISGKGNGFIASKDILKHTIILIDESIISHVKMMDSVDVNLMVIYLIMNLPDKKIKQFESLLPHSNDNNFIDMDIKNKIKKCSHSKIKSFLQKQSIERIKLYLEKYKRNAFNLNNLYDDGGVVIPGILLSGAIFNHSCDPNVSFAYSNSKMYFFTNKDVKKGEELCDAYVDVSIKCSDRQKELYERYGFMCGCGMCQKEHTILSHRSIELKMNKSIDIKKLKI